MFYNPLAYTESYAAHSLHVRSCKSRKTSYKKRFVEAASETRMISVNCRLIVSYGKDSEKLFSRVDIQRTYKQRQVAANGNRVPNIVLLFARFRAQTPNVTLFQLIEYVNCGTHFAHGPSSTYIEKPCIIGQQRLDWTKTLFDSPEAHAPWGCISVAVLKSKRSGP